MSSQESFQELEYTLGYFMEKFHTMKRLPVDSKLNDRAHTAYMLASFAKCLSKIANELSLVTDVELMADMVKELTE